MLPKTEATETLWNAYRAACGVSAETDYAVVALCRAMSLERADQLAALVLSGGKTATVSLLRDYGDGTEPLPAPGDHVVLTDGSLTPVCIWRTTEIVVKPLTDVDAQFARYEGEDDLSIPSWWERRRAYFGFQARTEGFAFSDDLPGVFERFEVVWPARA